MTKGIVVQHPSSPVTFDPPPSDPREQAVAMPEDTCSVCGVSTKLHVTVTNRWIGCAGAKERRDYPSRSVERWNDIDVALTLAIKRAMVEDCGDDFAEMIAPLTNDELQHKAHAIANAVRKHQHTRGRL